MARTPESANLKEKMLTASSRDTVRRHFLGIAVEIDATDYDDVEYDSGESFPPSPALHTYLLP